MIKMFFLLFLVGNFCCKNFASASHSIPEQGMNGSRYHQTYFDDGYYSTTESSIDELVQTLAKRPILKKLIINFTLNPEDIIKLFSGIGKMPALEVLEIIRYRHFEASVTTQQVVDEMNHLLVSAAEEFLAEESSHKSYSSDSSESDNQSNQSYFDSLKSVVILDSDSNKHNCESNKNSSLSSSMHEESDFNYHDLIESLAKEEVKTLGEDFSKSFIELSSAETIEQFHNYIHYPAPSILKNPKNSKARKKLMQIFFGVKKQMEQKLHLHFHENGRGYIPSALAEAINCGLFKNLKQLILPHQNHLSGAPFDEAEAIVWMRKILPGVNAIFAA